MPVYPFRVATSLGVGRGAQPEDGQPTGGEGIGTPTDARVAPGQDGPRSLAHEDDPAARDVPESASVFGGPAVGEDLATRSA